MTSRCDRSSSLVWHFAVAKIAGLSPNRSTRSGLLFRRLHIALAFHATLDLALIQNIGQTTTFRLKSASEFRRGTVSLSNYSLGFL